jgi:serine/threonine protein kinase
MRASCEDHLRSTGTRLAPAPPRPRQASLSSATREGSYITPVTGSPSASDTAARLAKALGAPYQLRTLIGGGGFAEVYEVWDVELERRLAVKVLRPDVAWTTGMLQRFKQETRAIARLQHPNILPIHFVGEGEGLVYYAMPLVEGESLGDVLRNTGALSCERSVAIAIPILDALQHAHERGLVHRDIKPDNIMLDVTTGRPMLVDFGIAKRLDAAGGLTQTGFVVGTPHYMSPEQALGQGELDARSDVYSFGAVLYQMVTGAPPFDGESSQEIVGKHIADPPPFASSVNAAVPPWLSSVIARCLAKKPTDRFQTAATVAAALRAAQTSGPISDPERRSPHPAAVDTDAETELVASGERPEASRARRLPWRRAVIGTFVVAAAAIAALVLLRPRLVFTNPLVAPVRLIVGNRDYMVPAGERVVVRLPSGRPASILWTLVPPSDSLGGPLGSEMSGAFTVERPRGRIRRHATPTSGDQAYFAPLVTNETDEPITVVVNPGTGVAATCRCWVPPGAPRAVVGYYPLYQDSRVQVRDRLGRTATFEGVAAQVNQSSGAVGTPVNAGAFR